MEPADRAVEVAQLLAAAAEWAGRRPDVRGLALVGSWARGTALADSDVDLILLTDRLAAYVDRDEWAGEIIPGAGVVATREWGAVTERRLALPSGLEVEVGVAHPSWAATDPVDPGTRRVVRDGLRMLHDPHGLLAALLRACREKGAAP